ncbi:YAL018C-like protein [Saccharomyces cerevisiae Vin13]|nr:YAL018C-like protein [Saccharomyces cerevisiae Vin13]
MSFTGSLALAGIGGLVYKFGGGQSYEKLPYVNIPFNQYLDKVYKKHFSKVMSRTRYVLMNFFKDAFTGGAFMYPFKGFLEFNTNKSSYSTTMLGILSSYLDNVCPGKLCVLGYNYANVHSFFDCAGPYWAFHCHFSFLFASKCFHFIVYETQSF